jgi:hypothetical protein
VNVNESRLCEVSRCQVNRSVSPICPRAASLMHEGEERAESMMAVRFDEKLNEQQERSDQIITDLKMQLE